jgi:hypothetical protein
MLHIKYNLDLPYHYGEIVNERLKVLDLNKKYDGFTLNENLEIVKRICSIESDGSWNYHNNYDNSENVLKIGSICKWWTLSEVEIKKVQKEHLDKAIKLLTEEIERLKSIY